MLSCSLFSVSAPAKAAQDDLCLDFVIYIYLLCLSEASRVEAYLKLGAYSSEDKLHPTCMTVADRLLHLPALPSQCITAILTRCKLKGVQDSSLSMLRRVKAHSPLYPVQTESSVSRCCWLNLCSASDPIPIKCRALGADSVSQPRL